MIQSCLHAFALEAHGAGLRTVLLGADTPLDEIAIALARARGDAIVISSSTDPTLEFLRRALPRLVREAAAPVFVGGTTSLRHRAAIAAAGALPLGIDLEWGVRRVIATLARNVTRQ